jgi:hypothetical protein
VDALTYQAGMLVANPEGIYKPKAKEKLLWLARLHRAVYNNRLRIRHAKPHRGD